MTKWFIRDDDVTENYNIFSLNLEEKDYDITMGNIRDKDMNNIDVDNIITIENLINLFLEEEISFRTFLLLIYNNIEFLYYINNNLIELLYNHLSSKFFLDFFLKGSNDQTLTLENFFSLIYNTYNEINDKYSKKEVDSVINDMTETYWEDLDDERMENLKREIIESLDLFL